MAVDARKYGVKFDGVTDDTAALQVALDHCPLTGYMGLPNPNDWPCQVLQLPAGRAKTTAPLLLPANSTLRGHGPASTYIANHAGGSTVRLKTGGEVQTTIRDLGLILQHPEARGIDLIQSGAPSILGDAAHEVDNVVVVGGRRALYCENNTECRFTNIKAYRQTPLVGDAAIYLGGSDHVVERVTVAQPQHPGGGPFDFGGAALRAGVSNTRFVNVKVFGGSSGGKPMQSAFYLIGQRNQVHALEVQDYPGGYGIEDPQGLNSYSGVVIDSCQKGGIYGNSPITMRNVLLINRGGAFTMPYAFNINNDSGADIDARVIGVPKVFATEAQTGAGNYIRVNGASL